MAAIAALLAAIFGLFGGKFRLLLLHRLLLRLDLRLLLRHLLLLRLDLRFGRAQSSLDVLRRLQVRSLELHRVGHEVLAALGSLHLDGKSGH